MAVAAFGQPPTRALRFEVASVKPALSPVELMARGQRPPKEVSDRAQFQTYNTLSGLIRKAYRLETDQKLVGPDWMDTTHFEVTAKLPEGTSKEQIPEMLQDLLAQRFKLVVRREANPESVYFLSIDKDGLKLQEAPPGASPSEPWRPRSEGQIRFMQVRTHNGWIVYSSLNGRVILEASRISMKELAGALKREVEFPVIDRTGLTGFYDVWTPVPATWNNRVNASRNAQAGSAMEPSDPSGVNLFKELEKMGLRLDKGKLAIEHLFVEHLEKIPTEN
jgi:uncharacterized protein (TIGR03435 family)